MSISKTYFTTLVTDCYMKLLVKNGAAISAGKLQRIRNAVHAQQIFLVVDDSILSGIQYLNMFVGNLETPHATYLYDYQLLSCTLNSDSIVQAVSDAVRSLGIKRNSFCLCCLMLQNILWLLVQC